MDAAHLNTAVLILVGAAVFFYVLYGVVKAATRDGIIAARRLMDKDEAQARSLPDA
ncbi:hypothetical protein V1639_03725 [Pseudarthrobacter sp. J75]|uniref:hypothetical protein n=1 Tax=unclassified Pseudarthrobacter TaxID=2647000 RepID=UPI002E803594|nr:MULTISPECIES: hypothetical protein [unclassified Pseudarthrobacter]MEE2522215.1 hypothetical protein [Pseudarthrobacter sp. J47]MEE2528139.1 hypothetical protein [Pseudarthrobacter sp. J75]MEE2567841.1 hypothetical protein [Pseudarthrobacter sp. J64]